MNAYRESYSATMRNLNHNSMIIHKDSHPAFYKILSAW